MKDIWEISKYIIPSMVVFATAYLIIKEFFKQEGKKLQMQAFIANQKEITPIRLQAYERLVLLLERIHPESLIIRENETGMNNLQLQQKLILAVRSEYEHNLSQQVYVSPKLWVQVKDAKDSIIQLINSEAKDLEAGDSSLNLCKAIIESHMQIQKPQIETAISAVKDEISSIWN